MADYRASTPQLRWGRDRMSGRFFINQTAIVPLSTTQSAEVPVNGFLLSKDEEAELKRALMGLEVATKLPALEVVH